MLEELHSSFIIHLKSLGACTLNGHFNDVVHKMYEQNTMGPDFVELMTGFTIYYYVSAHSVIVTRICKEVGIMNFMKQNWHINNSL